MTYRDILEQWWAVRRLSLAPTTIIAHIRIMGKDIIPTFGDMDIQAISSDILADFLGWLKAAKTI